jgi:heme-degrading monooxygenase HmoA
MIHVIIRHKVADYGQWKQVFDSHLNSRMAAGETGSRVFVSVNDSHEVTVFSDWDSADHARRFLASDDLKAAMKKAGVVGDPDVSYVQDAVSIRRTSAD